MPDWLTVAIAVATPLLAFAGAFGGQVLARKGARELDTWRRREETMRMLRWASEQAVADDGRRSVLGVAALDGLRFSELLQPADYSLVDSVTEAVQGETLLVVEGDPDAQVVEEIG